MKISQSEAIAGVLVVAAIIVVYLVFFSNSGRYDELAMCINRTGAKMYGAWWCPHCNDQKDMFGGSWKYMNYVECSNADGTAQTQACIDANVTVYPTWEYGNGTRHTGVLSLDQLAALTNCTEE